MPLSRATITATGQTLCVLTVFGFGWLEYDSERITKRMDVPRNFEFVAEDFWEMDAAIVAVVGLVVEPGHLLDGLQLCALPVPFSEIDFKEKQGNYNLLLTPKRPHLTGSEAPPGYGSVIGAGYPEFRGYARSIRLKV